MKVQKYLTWVQGNKLTLVIPMQKVTFTVEGKVTEDYTPPAGSQIVVELRSQNYVYRYSPEVKDGNVLKFSDDGKLNAGTYAVIVEVTEPDGTLRRSQWNNVLTVVASTSLVLDAYEDFPEWAEGAVVNGSCGASDKEPTCQCRRHRDAGSISGSGRSPGGGHDNPLQYCAWRIHMERGAWQSTVHRLAQSQT